jgi:CBS domain-containing protein
MTRRDEHLDVLVRHLGAAYYQARHGDGSAADVTRALQKVAEAEGAGAQETAQDAPAAPGTSGRTGRWRVSDVMTTKVISVTRHSDYHQIAGLLHEHHLSAVPVITSEGRVAGVVFEADLLRKQELHESADREPAWLLRPADRTKADARTAEELMTAPAVTIGPDALLGTAARLMSARHVKRLPVVDEDGKLVGIVSRTDLLRVFLRPDADIDAEVTAVLTDIVLADPAQVRVSVHKGMVALAGRLASEEQVTSATHLIGAIDGVVSVTSKLHVPRPENWPGAGYHIPA